MCTRWIGIPFSANACDYVRFTSKFVTGAPSSRPTTNTDAVMKTIPVMFHHGEHHPFAFLQDRSVETPCGAEMSSVPTSTPRCGVPRTCIRRERNRLATEARAAAVGRHIRIPQPWWECDVIVKVRYYFALANRPGKKVMSDATPHNGIKKIITTIMVSEVSSLNKK